MENKIKECKLAFKENNLKEAWRLWCDITDELLLNKKDFEEYDKYMKLFTNDEVYKITDYGKKLAYRQMELEKTYSILDKSLKLFELTKDEKMKSLDEFLSFYEWCILKSDDPDKYNIYDLQTNCVIDEDENEENKTIDEVIDRVVGRAIDYEMNEVEDDNMDEEYSRYLEDLYDIASRYNKKDNWLNYFGEFVDSYKKWLKDNSVCLVCGNKKDDFRSAYCDKCWEEEKNRLGVC